MVESELFSDCAAVSVNAGTVLSFFLSFEGLSYWSAIRGFPKETVAQLKECLMSRLPEHKRNERKAIISEIPELRHRLFWVRVVNILSFLLRNSPVLVVFLAFGTYLFWGLSYDESIWDALAKRGQIKALLCIVMIAAIVQFSLSIFTIATLQMLTAFLNFEYVRVDRRLFESLIPQLQGVSTQSPTHEIVDFPFDSAKIAIAKIEKMERF